MRLLNTVTGQFKEFTDHRKVPYAILSHTWDSSGEQTYQELKEIQKCFSSTRTLPLRDPVHLKKEGLSSQEAPPFPPKETAVPSDGRTHTVYRLLALLIAPLLFLMRYLRRAPHTSNSPPMTDPIVPVVSIVSIWDHPELSCKIRRACAVARAHGYRYLWIDSCCIDKTSSSELSEAINSMFVWYRDAAICYTFLADVPDRSEENSRTWEDKFQSSRWFKRGWTLQELIAPRYLVFLSKEWQVLGTKSTLIEAVQSATGIQPAILDHSRPLSSVGVATRMSWAARRETTRVEDQAYSLLGLFGITMPTLYGEGQRAFTRLQEEILRRIPDQSLFAWGLLRRGFISTLTNSSASPRWSRSLHAHLASTPGDFSSSDMTQNIPLAHDEFLSRLGRPGMDIPVPEYTISPHGIRTQIPLVPIPPLFPADFTIVPDKESSNCQWYLALFACEPDSTNANRSVVARVCYVEPSPSGLHLLRCGFVETHRESGSFHLVALSPHEIQRCRPHIHLQTVYLPLPDLDAHLGRDSSIKPAYLSDYIQLSSWAKATLDLQGYEVITHTHTTLPTAKRVIPRSYSIELVKDADTINIECEWFDRVESLRVIIRLPASNHSTAQIMCYNSLDWKYTRRDPYMLVECPTFKFRDLTRATLALRLAFQSEPGFRGLRHLHAEITKERTKESGNRTEGTNGDLGLDSSALEASGKTR